MNHQNFSGWSNDWKKLRNSPGRIEDVLAMWAINPPTKGLRESWDMAFGYRKRTSTGGEKDTEKLLLDQKHILIRNDKKTIQLETEFHNFPMARFKKGQVIADCFGFIQWKKKRHPITIEVKIKANNSWFAVVENLQQVKMVRSNIKNLSDFFKKNGISAKGAWGIVIAPKAYYKGKRYAQACNLLDVINTKKTEARITLVSSNLLLNGILEYQYGYWPK